MSLPLPALIAQLRAAYPTATLLSELAAIESNRFVVRALVQIGSVTLATGLAAAADVESAEDQAKCRAIEAFMPSAAPTPAPAIFTPAESADPASRISPPEAPSLPSLETSSPAPIALKAEPPRSAPLPAAETQPKTAPPLPTIDASSESLTNWDDPLRSSPSSSNLDLDFDLNNLLQDRTLTPSPNSAAEEAPLPAADLFAAVSADPAMPIDPPVNLSDLNLTRLKLPQTDSSDAGTPAPEKPSRRKNATPEPIPPTEIDRSGEIARIGVEMKRLGWDTKKGRDHLQKTYGKRSRQELNDDELMDFLRYLEAQPSSAQMPF